MALRDTTVVFLCALLGLLVLLVPLPVFDGPYEGLREGEVSWTCSMPLLSLAPPDVHLDDLRAAVADAHATALATSQRYLAPSSRHPLCGGLARTQVVLGLLAFAGAFWRARRWWKLTADARAEKRFQRLHESVEGSRGRSQSLR